MTANRPRDSKPRRLLHRLAPLVAIGIFTGALAILHRQLDEYSYRDLVRLITELRPSQLGLALGFTALGYVTLMGYDLLAVRSIGLRVERAKIFLTAFIAFAFSQSLGFALLTGGGVRYRLYAMFGLSTVQIANVIALWSVTFWLGVVTVGGSAWLFVAGASQTPFDLPVAVTRLVGGMGLLLAGAYLIAVTTRRAPLRLAGWEFKLPRPSVAAAQVGLGSLDWLFAAAVLYVLLPPDARIGYPAFVGVFALAQTAGVVSQVPAGLGVLESVVLLGMADIADPGAVLVALVAYRTVYYLLPFTVAVALFAVYELRSQRTAVLDAARATARWAPALAPRILAGASFLGGAVLLVSGATPESGTRLAWLSRLVPLGIIEGSHFVGSLVGLGLLVLAWGLRRRIDIAYFLAVGFLAAGIVLSLLRGLDYVEAAFLTIMLVALLPAKRLFYRKASLLSEPLSPSWVLAVGAVLVASGWLGLFAYKRVEFTDDLWWRFALNGNAPRFLRASVGVVAAAAIFSLVRLFRPRARPPALPDEDTLEHAHRIIQTAPRAAAHIALTGDKTLLFNARGNAFLMFAVSGRSWVTYGEPVGPEEAHEDLIWQFRRLVDRDDGYAVFYQIDAERLGFFVEMGLDAVKIGEEARVPLADFSLDGSIRRDLRKATRQIESSGCRFEVVPASRVAALLPELRGVSDAWLEDRHTREKGFSLGRFDPGYLARLPSAVVWRGEQIVAFATVWPSAHHEEISADLVRYAPDAPRRVMDYLFAQLMIWGRGQGFRFFNLGMAPLAGLDGRQLEPIWNRVSALVFRHGEHFYNFQGLRAYKNKYDPEWTPRYLVSPGGLALPRIVADIAVLIAGGWRGVITK